MRPKLLPLHIPMAAIGAGSLIMSLWLGSQFSTWRWQQEPLHSAVEAIGGLAAIAMGVVLLQRTDPVGIRLYPVAGGFLGMGLLEIIHAVAEPGNAFILLRSIASLVGGIGFTLIWLPSDKALANPRVLISMMAAGSLGFGLWALVSPERIPPMIRDDAFTPTALTLQGFACMFFAASAYRFSFDYRQAGHAEDALFATLAFLFALAEVMFVYSTVWDSRWWFWHGVRLIAYLLVLGSMVQAYRRMLLELQRALAQTTRAEETARLSEEQLRSVLEMRERMAQDLHDGIIQSLFALGLNLERCGRLVAKNPNAAVEQLGSSSGGIKSIIRDLRAYITGLEPAMTNGQDLGSVLASLANTMEASAELRCRIEVDPAVAARMTEEQARHIVHIVREAVSNSVRHGKARNELVSLQWHDERARLIVEDDGNGFNPNLANGEGEGLKNMAARANRLGARFEVRSQLGQGARLVFDIPVEGMHA